MIKVKNNMPLMVTGDWSITRKTVIDQLLLFNNDPVKFLIFPSAINGEIPQSDNINNLQHERDQRK